MSFLSDFKEDPDTGNRFSAEAYGQKSWIIVSCGKKILATCDGQEVAEAICKALNETAEIDAICEQDDLFDSGDFLNDSGDS